MSKININDIFEKQIQELLLFQAKLILQQAMLKDLLHLTKLNNG